MKIHRVYKTKNKYYTEYTKYKYIQNVKYKNTMQITSAKFT